MGHRRAPGYGYTPDYQEERERRARAEEAAVRERARVNESFRKERRDGLAATKQAAQQQHEAATDLAIESRMAVAQRQWQIDHPGKDFAQVKPLVREQLIEEHAAAVHEEVKRQLLATGNYPR